VSCGWSGRPIPPLEDTRTTTQTSSGTADGHQEGRSVKGRSSSTRLGIYPSYRTGRADRVDWTVRLHDLLTTQTSPTTHPGRTRDYI